MQAFRIFIVLCCLFDLCHRKNKHINFGLPYIVFFRSSKISFVNPVFCVSGSATKAEYNTAD